ncbi:S8 family serine peptidase [Paenibacillus sp. GSMTC-2017]|uniref:S8 family serine peptidase n=1 Tax=Paenibacillus sp. GSMTC-2017 TaxID=2794350 RepID=UPI0018D9FD09|nr:S8 family serine peptidase [Paenibacillus sp. GSMTC-2017]MBH5320581.1 S8 family serine peptidase [Paenibacillus sp. GSMTC-2017]
MTINWNSIIDINRDQQSPHLESNSSNAILPRERKPNERLDYRRGAHSLAPQARGKRLRRALVVLLIGSVALGGVIAPVAPAPVAGALASAVYADAGAALEQPQSWLLKWTSPAKAHKLRGVEVIRRQEAAAVEVVRPAADWGEDVDAWLDRLSEEPGVEYIHPNNPVSILSLSADDEEVQADSERTVAAPLAAVPNTNPNDPELPKQSHLAQIGAQKAWETVREQKELTIALVDTGVELDHPDLKDNLVQGANLVNPKKSPADDNGHGTSVAGVIAAAGNNGIGGSGVLWRAKIMPVKALDEWGDGTELDLGEAILYAVKNGAKIIVMSVGLHRYSPYMQDIVNYAENKGVLLVAASGNDGVKSGNKTAVKYPAAYPTVLAVGGVQPNNRPDQRSNSGTELDILAPWNVFTTALGGKYKQEEGTSMAAPQVAAAAALVWAQHPEYKPLEVRELLRQTAKDIGVKGVDSTSGYGLLAVDRAVQAILFKDANEPNDRRQSATTFPLFNEMKASIGSADDMDWYVIETPNEGTLTLNYRGAPEGGGTIPVVRITHHSGGKLTRAEDIKLSSKIIEFDVSKGKQVIGLTFSNPDVKQSLNYSLTNSFAIWPDRFEPNDQLNQAKRLEAKSQSVTGTFGQTGDRDWYVVDFQQDGKLELSLSTDTVRIDPGLSLQKDGHSLILYDEHREGEGEHSPVISVTRGKYYIRVHNAIALEASPTIGHYTLKIGFTPQLDDPNEPNDKSYEALLMSPGTEYKGVMGTASDTDWFQFRVSSQSVVSLSVSGIPSDATLQLEGLDKRMTRIASGNSGTSGKLKTSEQVLKPGVYYVKLTSSKAFNNQFYRLNLQSEELISGFRDIKGHWAKDDIVSLTKLNIVKGVGGYRFEPERSITRAEAVAMIVKAYKPITNMATSKQFTDVSASHWASGAIQKAVQQGWVRGFPDGSFRPNSPITRAEMAVIIGYAEALKVQFPLARPFADVAPNDWYSPMLFAMKVDGKLQGIERNQFKPDEKASRGQFTSLLYRYYKD